MYETQKVSFLLEIYEFISWIFRYERERSLRPLTKTFTVIHK